jgi:hypothetical protein
MSKSEMAGAMGTSLAAPTSCDPDQVAHRSIAGGRDAISPSEEPGDANQQLSRADREFCATDSASQESYECHTWSARAHGGRARSMGDGAAIQNTGPWRVYNRPIAFCLLPPAKATPRLFITATSQVIIHFSRELFQLISFPGGSGLSIVQSISEVSPELVLAPDCACHSLSHR